jgi:16S rRNA (cytidine1402-2'-O)-methyltransferase
METSLYIIPTPIGNISEVSKRTIDLFNEINIFICEDTRTTIKLFNLLKIDRKDKRFISNHKFNETKKVDEIIQLLKENNVGLVSDAGAPTINDPGYIIVKAVKENNINVVPISGPSSLINMIMGSGIEMDKFSYVGFLPKKKKELIDLLNEQFDVNSKILFLLSVHQFESVLKIIDEVYPTAYLSIGKELTKKYETFMNGTASEVLKMNPNPKGEYIGIIEYTNNEVINDETLLKDISDMKLKNETNKNILNILQTKYPSVSKNKLYSLINKN